MSDLYNTILDLCRQKGIKPSNLADEIGFSRGGLTDLKMGRSKSLSASTMNKIADYFGVSTDALMGREEIEKPAAQDDGFKIGPVYLSLAKDMQKEGIHPDDVRDMIEILKRRRNDKG